MIPSSRYLFSATTYKTFRALVYSQHGKPPSSVLKAVTFKPLAPPEPHQARVKILLSPINPADLNVIEGVYPSKPEPRSDLLPLAGEGGTLSIAGNEAVGVITQLPGESSSGLKVGDRVILDKSQLGVWATYQNVDLEHLVKVHDGVSDVAAATLRVSFIFEGPMLLKVLAILPQINPSTALAVLKHVGKVRPGDWIIQNGANSAVGTPTTFVRKPTLDTSI